jgi:hypothetical protein
MMNISSPSLSSISMLLPFSVLMILRVGGY